jgi:hypothetical protein
LTAAERSENRSKEQNLKFEFFSPLECLQADVMYGPELPDETGKPRKALLMAFLDDATRRVVYSRFSFSEKSILFEDGVKHILRAQGMIGRLYTDYTEKKQIPKFIRNLFRRKEIALKTSA